MTARQPRSAPRSHRRNRLPWLASGLLVVALTCNARGADEKGLLLRLVDKANGEPVAGRIHLRDSRGKPVIPPRTVAWKDHFVVDGQIRLDLRPGTYSYEIERGPEYRRISGRFVLERGASDEHTESLERFVDMSRFGWWSGDLHIHRRPEDMPLLLRAEDLHIGPVITWWNEQNRWEKEAPPAEPVVRTDGNRMYDVLAGEDEREGGALLFFHLPRPLAIRGATREYPSGAQFLTEARQQAGVHVDVEKPFWWDMPVWVATGQVDSIGLANNHLWRDGGLHNEAWGRPRDPALYPDPHGNGRYSTDLYYQLLNCGLRIPPSAGSASGVLNNPVGYNRVYVQVDSELTWQKWWDGLRAGRVVVTNGPLLRVQVNQHWPGHVFTAPAGTTVELNPFVELATRDKIDYLEVVQDGVVKNTVRLADYGKSQGKLPPLAFTRSGWMLIRAVTNYDRSYRFASSGPFYVSIGQQPRISRKAAQFFLDWVVERARRLKLPDSTQRAEVIAYHRAARDFWQDLVSRANEE